MKFKIYMDICNMYNAYIMLIYTYIYITVIYHIFKKIFIENV